MTGRIGRVLCAALLALGVFWEIDRPAAAEAAPEVVQVGVYPTVVDDLNIAASTYDVTAYVWMRWKGDADPTTSLEFANATERQNFTHTYLLKEPKLLADGSRYQIMQIHGRFFQPFSLLDFPFDKQRLTLVLEEELSSHDRIVYAPDSAESGFSPTLEVPGWQIKGWESVAMVQNYGSHFGDTDMASRRAGLKFDIVIARRLSFFVWKLLLPLIIVLCANWLAFVIRPELLDVRVALTATALLTLVFLQKSYSDELPEVGVLVLMDKIYAVAYLMVLATLAHVVAVSWWQRAADVSDKKVIRVDWTSLGVHVLFFAVTVSLLVISALH